MIDTTTVYLGAHMPTMKELTRPRGAIVVKVNATVNFLSALVEVNPSNVVFTISLQEWECIRGMVKSVMMAIFAEDSVGSIFAIGATLMWMEVGITAVLPTSHVLKDFVTLATASTKNNMVIH